MAKFISKCQNQVLCIKPKRVQVIEGIAQVIEGQHIRFENGEVETSNKDEVAFIRKHRLFGNQIFEEKSESEPAPTT
jgi:hypothetical protein